jgi:hypothetical protein
LLSSFIILCKPIYKIFNSNKSNSLCFFFVNFCFSSSTSLNFSSNCVFSDKWAFVAVFSFNLYSSSERALFAADWACNAANCAVISSACSLFATDWAFNASNSDCFVKISPCKLCNWSSGIVEPSFVNVDFNCSNSVFNCSNSFVFADCSDFNCSNSCVIANCLKSIILLFFIGIGLYTNCFCF